ncbi:MAG: hypothetical protein RR547_07310, partial [Raoultibacter sp.]
GTKMPRSDWTVVSNTEFMIPKNKNEQSQIGKTFANLDTLITLHQRELFLLKTVIITSLKRLSFDAATEKSSQ